jgi:pyruvate formate-lyase/glycerol dehydratase family glycyl radical enzyme
MANIMMKEIQQDPDLNRYTLDNLPLLKRLKEDYLGTRTAVCIERAKHITAYMKNPDSDDEPMELKRARAINRYMSQREPIFHSDNLIAGSTTSKKLGAPVYPEFLGLSIWPELDTISTRKTNPQQLTTEEADILNFDIFPYWMDRTVLEATRAELTETGSPTLKALELMEKIAFFMAGKTTVISHTTPYFEKVLARGLNAMIAEAKQKESETPPDQTEKKVFYHAMQVSMQGILDYARNLSARATELADREASVEKKKHYKEIADVCARVPAEPAQSLREAVNSLWLCQVGILAENVNMAMNPGRLDQILFPYFKKDLEQNKITIEETLTLLGCLWLKISDNTNLVPESAEKLFGGAGSVPAVTVGGIDKEGNDAVNDLTYLLLKVTELLVTKDPNVNARYHPGINDETYRDRVIRVINNTRAIPAFFNDITNIATLENQGVATEHARDYAVIGCVELASAGREYSSSSSLLMNITAAMDMTLFNGKRPYITGSTQIGPQTGEPEDLKTFEEFQTAFEAQLKNLVEMGIDLNEALGKKHQELVPTPLLSCFFEGPMEKGKDLIYGGALYNSSGTTHVGFADVCDSLNAIEDAVYINKEATLKEIRDAIEVNFKDHERLHAYLVNKTPKYGTDDSDAEHPIAVKNSRRLVKFLYDLYQSHINYRGGKYRPAYWTMTNHAGLGKIAQALPSGRKAGEVFSSGITPASQAAQDLTGAYISVGKLDSQYIPGAFALNMKYTPEPPKVDPKAFLDHFAAMLEAYFKQGGMQVQYNIRTYANLIDAMKHPDKPGFRELLVRVSGYSAYFKDLNDAMKEELITRTQYGLEDGKAVPLDKSDIN